MNDRPGDDGRDEPIGRRLDRLATPAHGDGFWQDLRAGIARTPGAARGGGEAAGRPRADDTGPRVIPLDRPVPGAGGRAHRARRMRLVLAAAAVVVVVAAAAAVVATLVADDGGGDAITAGPDPSPEPTTDTVPQPTAEPPPTPATPEPDGGADPDGASDPVDWTTVESTTVLGTGHLVAASPDGRWLYVADRDPDGGAGCEGADRATLFVVDATTGERRLADAGLSDTTGGIDVYFDGTGRVAVLEQCEGFVSRLAVGTVGIGGAFAAPTELAVQALGQFVSDLAWSSDGSLLVAAVTIGPDGEQRRLLRVDPTTGTVDEVVADDVVVFGELPDGQIVAGTTTGVRVPDARVIDRATPYGIEISPDGTLAAIQGPDVVEIVDTTTGEVVSTTSSDGEAGADGAWTDDGRAYLATFLQLDTLTSRQLVSIDPTGTAEPTGLVDGLDFSEITVVGRDRLAVSRWVDDLGNSEIVVVTFGREPAGSGEPTVDVVATSLEGIADATLPTTLIEEGIVTLTDGAFFRGAPGDAQFAEVALRAPVATADVDDDGTDDALVVLDGGFGGSGVSSELVVLLARPGGFVVGGDPVPLGVDIRLDSVFDPAEGPVVHGPGAEFVYDTRAEGTSALEFDIRRTLLLEANDGIVEVVDTIDESIGG